MKEQVFIHVNELVCKALEGGISAEEGAALNQYVASDPEIAAYYVRCIRIYSGLKKSPQMQYLFCLEQFEDNLRPFSLDALAEYEKIAPAAMLPMNSIPVGVISVREKGEKTARKINKASLMTALVSLAALVFFVVFARYAPVRGSEFVATISDSIEAQWADVNESLGRGARLTKTSGPWLLRKGVVKLMFDNHTEVLLEGPAEFQITAEDRMRVNYGRLYAIVPRSALGFSVITPNSTIIDLGTEFGVLAGFDGGTELHVIKGETALVAGQHNEKSSVLVKAGVAKRIYGFAASVSDIMPNERLFIRKIDSEANLVWRGEAVDLADAAGGGGGFGGGKLNGGYNPLKGELEVFSEIARPSVGPEAFRPIHSNPLVDGVFVPNGKHGPVRVSTQGHLFENCPATNGEFWQGVFNGAWHGGRFTEIPKHHLRLAGKTYGTGQYAAIYMHANQGITFDLDAIRKSVGGLNLVRFHARAGISESVMDYPELIVRNAEGRIESPRACFYVLVDGTVRFEKIDVSPEDAAETIDIPLTAQDRFLTLVTTQGSDKMGINHDWTLFAEPVLQVQRP